MNTPLIDNEALAECLLHLLDDDEDARYAAAHVVARMGRPILPRALAWADDPRPRMREMACYILGQVGDWDERGVVVVLDPEGVPFLLRLLETDPEAEIRASAAAALGQHAVPATVPALARRVGDPFAEVRLHVAMALGSFYSDTWDAKDQSHREAAAAALLHLMGDADEDVRDWATFGIH